MTVPSTPIPQLLATDDGDGNVRLLGAIMGTDFLVPRDHDAPELRSVKRLVLGLGHTFNQLQDHERAHDEAKAREPGHEVVEPVYTLLRLSAQASAETFVRGLCGFVYEFLQFLIGKEDGQLPRIEAWPRFAGCVEAMAPRGKEAWARLRQPSPSLLAVVKEIRNAGGFHIGVKDIGRALDWSASRMPGPFFGHFTFSEDAKVARFPTCDLAAQAIRVQAQEANGITEADLNLAIEDIQALGVHLMPELVSAMGNHAWDARVMPS